MIGRLRSLDRANVVGAAVCLGAGLVTAAQYGLHGNLSRDESVYAYAGQQAVDGTAPYASIFDPKGPVAMLVAGVGTALARLVGADDVIGIRLVFGVCAVASVGAVYALALAVARSVPAATLAGAALAVCAGWSQDAFGGPDAKTPAVGLVAAALLCMVRKRWGWAGCWVFLAAATWQPLVVALLPVLVLAICVDAGRSRRSAAGRCVVGAVVPLAVLTVYFAVEGAIGDAADATLDYPLRGIAHEASTLGQRLDRVGTILFHQYGVGGPVIVLGVVLLLAEGVLRVVVGVRAGRGSGESGSTSWVRDPVVLVLVPYTVLMAVYTSTDVQGPPDLYPFLPAMALGVAVAWSRLAGLASSRHVRPVVPAVALGVVLVAGVAGAVVVDSAHVDGDLDAQAASACAMSRLLPPGQTLWSFGNPTPLVLTGRTNPDRFVFLDSGEAQWKLRSLPGGLAGWKAQVERHLPAVAVFGGVPPVVVAPIEQLLLARGYRPGYLGPFRVLVAPDQVRRELAAFQVTSQPTHWPHTRSGARVGVCHY